MTFDNSKCNYATIIFSNVTIEGHCDYWEINGNNGTVKLIIDGKQYVTALSNVLLEED